MSTFFTHDPDANLDYSVDWSEWLQEGEEIIAVVWTVPVTEPALVHDDDLDRLEDGVATLWLAGGPTRGSAVVGCRITTDLGRIDERSLRLNFTQR